MKISKDLGKRALSLVLTFLMVISLVPLSVFSAFAAESQPILCVDLYDGKSGPWHNQPIQICFANDYWMKNGTEFAPYQVGGTYQLYGAKDIDGDKHYDLSHNSQKVTVTPDKDGKVHVDVYPASRVQITVKSSQGYVMGGQEVTLNLPLGEKKTAVTDTNGVADFGYIRSLYEVSAEVSYTDPDGTTKIANTGDFRVGDSDRNVTLTVPKRQLFNIQVNSNAIGSGITNAQVILGGTTLSHQGYGLYQGMIVRNSVLNQSFVLSISAPGYKSVSDSYNISTTNTFSKTYGLDLAPVALSDSSGNSIGSSLQLYTGEGYKMSVTLPDKASLTYSSINSQIGNYMSFSTSGNTLTINPLNETASGQSITLNVGYTLNSVKYTKAVAITIGQGNISGPAAPSITSSDLDATKVTFRLPSDLKMADKLTIVATGGVDNSVNKTQTYSNITSDGTLTMEFDKLLHGEVNFKCTYASSRVNYSSNSPVSVRKGFWKTVSNPSLEKTEYEYTGKPIRPVPQGENIKSLTYGSLLRGDMINLIVEMGDFTKLTTDNDITHQLIEGLGSPITYNDCPYVVTVTFDDYCTTGAPNSSGGYINFYQFFYTVVPRKLTVTVEDQTININNTVLDQSKYSLTSGTLLDGHQLKVTLTPNVTSGSIAAQVKVVNSTGGDVSKYYNVTVNEGKLNIYECDHKDYVNGICTVCGGFQPAIQNEDGYYEISNAGQLYWFAFLVNMGNANANAILLNDITVNNGDVAGCGGVKDEGWLSWTPIGNNNTQFKGVFDGKGHSISGLYYNASTTYNFGLFGNSYGTIKNVTVKNSYFSAKERIGAIVGWNNGLIENCANIGTYCKANQYVGGIASITSDGTIKNCYNNGTVDCATYRAGGITGLLQKSSKMENSFSCGIVSNFQNSNVGALVGLIANETTSIVEVTNCYYDSDVCDDSAFGFSGGEKATETINAVESKTSAECASGEVAYLLGDAFGQKIGTDEYPVLGGDKVYCGYTSCVENSPKVYSNSPVNIIHNYVNGICTVSGCYEPATLNEDGVYEIGNAGQLYWFADKVNNDNDNFKSANAILTDDIVVNEGELSKNNPDIRLCSPIGNDTNRYEGHFNGNNKVVSGLFYDDSTKGNCIALFGCIGENGVVEKIGIESSTINSCSYSGNIAGINYGKIENCYSRGNAYGGTRIGGIAGHNCSTGVIKNCYFGGNIGGGNVSLITNLNEGTVENCYSLKKYGCYEDNQMSAEQFASGEIAYLLGDAFGQKIGEDNSPVLGGDKVYYGYESCASTEKTYSNKVCYDEIPAHNHEMGDIDLDGIVTICDASTLSKYLVDCVELNSCQLSTADTNGDGKIDINDVTYIQKMIAELV